MNHPSTPIVITGAASGIGAATVAQLRATGGLLIGVDRNVPEAFDGRFVQGDLEHLRGCQADRRGDGAAWRPRALGDWPTSREFPAPRPGVRC